MIADELARAGDACDALRLDDPLRPEMRALLDRIGKRLEGNMPCGPCRVRWCAHTLNAKAGVAAASPIRGKQRMGLVAQIRALWEELGMQVQRVSKEI